MPQCAGINHGDFSIDGRYLVMTCEYKGWLVKIATPRGSTSPIVASPPSAAGRTVRGAVIDFATRRVVATWAIPGGGSPDMGNVSIDGKRLWLTGRYDDDVYVFDTSTGHLIKQIRVGKEPHGLTVWPQPGRYSLGHTGNMR